MQNEQRIGVTAAVLFVSLLLTFSVQAAPIIETELAGTATNNSLATAQAISASAFTVPVPATVFNPPGFPTATITGEGGSPDVDYYSLDSAGGQIYIDIDNNPRTFDNFVSLINSAGTLLAFGDETVGPGSLPGSPDLTPDLGSASTSDAFLGVFTLPGPGTYFLLVSQFGNMPRLGGCVRLPDPIRPDGGPGGAQFSSCPPGSGSDFPLNGPEPVLGLGYTMHVSLQTPVPEPSTWLLLGSGLIGMMLWRKRTA